MSGGTCPRAGARVFIVGVIACVGVIGAGFTDSFNTIAAASVATASFEDANNFACLASAP
jgi:hypothetical protein